MNYFCCHHSPNIERKRNMENIFSSDNIFAEWLTDFLPEDTLIQDHEKVYCKHARNKSFLNANELSLYYKHLEAFEKTIQSDQNAVIVEDDLKKPEFNFRLFCESVEQEFSKTDGDLVFLGGSRSHQRANSSDSLIYTSEGFMSRFTHCYMIKPETSKKLIDFLKDPKAPIDWQLNLAIEKFNLKVYWTYDVLLQKTDIGEEDSIIG